MLRLVITGDIGFNFGYAKEDMYFIEILYEYDHTVDIMSGRGTLENFALTIKRRS